MFVAHLAGSYTGVMGLPVCETGELLKKTRFPAALTQAGGLSFASGRDSTVLLLFPGRSPGR